MSICYVKKCKKMGIFLKKINIWVAIFRNVGYTMVPMGRRRCFESVIRLPIFYFIDPKEWHPL